MTAPGCNKSGALKTSALRNLSSNLVAKQRFLRPSIEHKKSRINAVSMLCLNKQLIVSRKKQNIVIPFVIMVDFVKRIMCSAKSTVFFCLFCLNRIFNNCRSPPSVF